MFTDAGLPNIFEYTSYRTYLSEVYRYRKQHERFSFRQFSKQAGFASPNFLKLVIEGKRNLSGESIEKIARGLKLDADQVEFFRHLVLLNQASTASERQHWAELLFSSRFFRKLNPLKTAVHAYYSNWFVVAVRELVALPSFQEDPEWIASSLSPQISPQEARAAIETLLKLGLLRRTAEGKLVQSEELVTTGDEVKSLSVAQFHREMIQKGSESIERFPAEKRDVSSVTLSVSEQGRLQIKTLIQRFRKDLLEIAARDQSPDEIVQINLQLFPLSGAKGKKEAA
jgi:uncharacterized protein (TIGR02147 family)